MSAADFEAWLAREAGDAAPPEGDEAGRGAALFLREGCDACHTVRGTGAAGETGPDLTHVGSRNSIGAGRLGNTLEDYGDWIANTDRLKPGVEMPPYSWLTDPELRDLAAYLRGLR